jgi:hypothetical protein
MIHEATNALGRTGEDCAAARPVAPSRRLRSSVPAYRVPRAPASSSGAGRANPAAAVNPQVFPSVNPQPTRRSTP